MVEVRAAGRRAPLAPRWGIALPEAWAGGEEITLRDVITRIVREQLAAWQQRQADASVLRAITERELREGASSAPTAPRRGL